MKSQIGMTNVQESPTAALTAQPAPSLIVTAESPAAGQLSCPLNYYQI